MIVVGESGDTRFIRAAGDPTTGITFETLRGSNRIFGLFARIEKSVMVRLMAMASSNFCRMSTTPYGAIDRTHCALQMLTPHGLTKAYVLKL